MISRISQYRKIFKDWHKAMFERILFMAGARNGNEILVRLNNGMKFKIRMFSWDLPILSEIFIDSPYTKNFSIPKNSVVVDIGAHTGAFSIKASKIAKEVYAYEPFPENFKLLLTNLSLNSCKNVKAFKLAIDKSSGIRKLYINEDNNGSSSFYSERTKDQNSIQVNTTSLKNVFNDNKIDRINFLKIDCEGAEYDILFNTPKKYLKRIDRITMECHNFKSHSISNMLQFLEKNGFSAKLLVFNKGLQLGIIHAKLLENSSKQK